MFMLKNVFVMLLYLYENYINLYVRLYILIEIKELNIYYRFCW